MSFPAKPFLFWVFSHRRSSSAPRFNEMLIEVTSKQLIQPSLLLNLTSSLSQKLVDLMLYSDSKASL